MRSFTELKDAQRALEDAGRVMTANDSQDLEQQLAAEIAHGALSWALEERNDPADKFARLLTRVAAMGDERKKSRPTRR
jgi:glycine/D-amino acid oxidase-like deaminating enzyme